MTRMVRMVGIVAALALFASITAACGGGSDSAEGPKTYTITMKEYSFTPNNLTFKEGDQVRIKFENAGDEPHEFMVGQELMYEDDEPHGYMNDFFEGMTPDFMVTQGEAELEWEDEGMEVYVEDGAGGVLTFTVPVGKAGTYEFGCFLPDHYQNGQKGTLTVVA